MRRKFKARTILFFILFGALAVLLFGFIVMALWNNILANVLHISTITFWQAIGILILSKILFSGFRGGWHGRFGHHGYWRKEMYEKWQKMTPEEREKFKQQWGQHCRGFRREVTEQNTTAGAE